MSRSYKHYAIDKINVKNMKKLMNKIIRKKLKNIEYEIGNYGFFKKMKESYNICDFIVHLSLERFMAEREQNIKMSSNECISVYTLNFNDYMKRFKRK